METCRGFLFSSCLLAASADLHAPLSLRIRGAILLDPDMFDFLTSTVKAAASVVSVPVAIAADVVTLGGSLTDQCRPYTANACADLVQNVKDMTKPRGE